MCRRNVQHADWILLELIANVELKFAGRAIEFIVDNWYTVVNTNRANGQIQSNTDTYVNVGTGRSKVIRVGIHKACIGENGAANTGYDWEREFKSDVAQRVAADGVPLAVHGADFAEIEAAHVVGTAKVEAVKDWNTTAVIGTIGGSQSVGDGQLAFGEENQIPREREIFGRFQGKSIIFDRSSECAATGKCGEFYQFPFACQEEAVASIPDEAPSHSTLGIGASGLRNHITIVLVGAGIGTDVVNFDIFKLIIIYKAAKKYSHDMYRKGQERERTHNMYIPNLKHFQPGIQRVQ